MSFSELMNSYSDFDFEGFWRSVSDDQVRRCLNADRLTPVDLLTLLSPRAADHLEPMAQRARRLTIQHFGRTIQLYIPLYISNFCNSECIYCGFNRRHAIQRRRCGGSAAHRDARQQSDDLFRTPLDAG